MFNLNENELRTRHRISKVVWTYLHLRPLHRIVVLFPVVPHHTFPAWPTKEVQTIQVGPEAIAVPPGAMITQCTVARALVVVAIFGGKRKTTMITEGITSSS